VYGSENPNVSGKRDSVKTWLMRWIPAWAPDKAKIRRIKELGVGPDIAQNMDTLLNACFQGPLTIRFTETPFPPAPCSLNVPSTIFTL
jgi:hypothetical protein